MGRNEYDISGHLHIFAFLNALTGAFEVQFFFRASFLPPYQRILRAVHRDMQLKFGIKVKHLLKCLLKFSFI